jgi:hypothetical protein
MEYEVFIKFIGKTKIDGVEHDYSCSLVADESFLLDSTAMSAAIDLWKSKIEKSYKEHVGLIEEEKLIGRNYYNRLPTSSSADHMEC